MKIYMDQRTESHIHLVRSSVDAYIRYSYDLYGISQPKDTKRMTNKVLQFIDRLVESDLNKSRSVELNDSNKNRG
jgi:hypothetical protein